MLHDHAYVAYQRKVTRIRKKRTVYNILSIWLRVAKSFLFLQSSTVSRELFINCTSITNVVNIYTDCIQRLKTSTDLGFL